MVKVHLHGKMAEAMLANIKMTLSMELVPTLGLRERKRNMKVNGAMAMKKATEA